MEMNMRHALILASIPLIASLAVTAMAAGPAGDYNDDGAISREEFRNKAAKVAFAADKNQNGFIEAGEYTLTDEQRRAMGKLSVEEFQTGQVAAFDALDKNKNGTLEANEKGR
jgi:Ca2+-binding EF-hand superfamily protein